MAPERDVIKTNAAGELYLESEAGQVTRLYRFKEVLNIAHIDAMTFYTWVTRGMLPDTRLRDRGRWRVFTEKDVARLVRIAREQGLDAPAWPVGRKRSVHEQHEPFERNRRETP